MVRRYKEHLIVTLLAALTLLAIYAAARYVVPQVLTWFKYVLVVLVPFILALVISVLLEPLIGIVQQYTRLSRSFAVIISMLLAFGGIGTVLTLIIVHLVAELTELSAALPGYVALIENYLKNIIAQGQLFYLTLPEQVTYQLEQVLNLERLMGTLGGTLQDWASSLANALLTLLAALPGAIIIIMVSIVATYFISRDRVEMMNFWVKIIPAPWGERSLDVSRQVANAFMAYIKAQLILVLITSIISILGLMLIGTNYAVTLGLVVGFFDLIPVLGPGAVYVPWAVWSFVTGEPGLGFKVLGLYIIVMVIRAMLEAKVVASNMGLHPLAVLVAMYVGLKTIGILGLIAGPIVVITIQAAIKAGTNVWKA
jgi:sporulation integral membrane protein YtvI